LWQARRERKIGHGLSLSLWSDPRPAGGGVTRQEHLQPNGRPDYLLPRNGTPARGVAHALRAGISYNGNAMHINVTSIWIAMALMCLAILFVVGVLA
jgi:hypothetical protein